jgi:hypothetical protein
VQALFTYVPTSGTLAPPSGLHVVLNP